MNELFVEEGGNERGEPMLLVHGFLSSAAQWDLNRDALGERLRLLMVELPGHGRSPTMHNNDYSIDAFVAALDHVRTQRGIDRWWICAQSLGAAIALHYCFAHPETVRGFVFTNSRAAFGVERRGVSDLARELSHSRELPMHPINAKRIPEPVKSRMVEAADHADLGAINALIALRHTWDATTQLSELACPALLINGVWEKAFQPNVARAQSLMSDLTVVNLEGGHAINIEQADAFNLAVLDFIQTQEDRPC